MSQGPDEALRARRDKLLEALERLLLIPAAGLKPALNEACQMLIEQLNAEKVDAFFYDPTQDALVAVGTSDTPLARKQVSLGLDRLPMSKGGRPVQVFRTGKPYFDGRVDQDEGELLGFRQGLGVRSHIAVPLEVSGERRGVLSVTSTRPDFFREEDLRFLEAVASWVGVVASRAELSEELVRQSVQHARRAAAEEIITVLAHDLGNHLGPLRARMELIRLRAEREKHPTNLRDAQDAISILTRLGRLIADLLDVARLDEGLFTLDIRPVDLATLSREVARVASTPEVQIEVRGENELVLPCDPQRIRQALENLVANAVKHSPPQVSVIVELSQEQRESGPWGVIHVIDQGPGIAPELLPTLFERFVAGANSVGLGLGLYLAREVAEAHGGTLTARSTPGEGASFELALPERAAPLAVPPGRSKRPPG